MRLRRLSAGEAALAQAVFGDTLDSERPRVLTGAPTGDWAMVVFGVMLFPTEIADFSAEPLHRQAWFVHELAHVRQFQTKPWWTLLSWAGVALSGGYFTRRAYAPPKPGAWLNLEQEAMTVEAGFLELAKNVVIPAEARSAESRDPARAELKAAASSGQVGAAGSRITPPGFPG